MFRDSVAPSWSSEGFPVRRGQWLTAGYIQVLFTQLPAFAMWKIGKDFEECRGSVLFWQPARCSSIPNQLCNLKLAVFIVWGLVPRIRGRAPKTWDFLFLSHAKLCEYWTDCRAELRKFKLRKAFSLLRERGKYSTNYIPKHCKWISQYKENLHH